MVSYWRSQIDVLKRYAWATVAVSPIAALYGVVAVMEGEPRPLTTVFALVGAALMWVYACDAGYRTVPEIARKALGATVEAVTSPRLAHVISVQQAFTTTVPAFTVSIVRVQGSDIIIPCSPARNAAGAPSNRIIRYQRSAA
jgi:hypothetical protein